MAPLGRLDHVKSSKSRVCSTGSQSVHELLRELAGVQAKLAAFQQRFASNQKAASFSAQISQILVACVTAVARTLTTQAAAPAASTVRPPLLSFLSSFSLHASCLQTHRTHAHTTRTHTRHSAAGVQPLGIVFGDSGSADGAHGPGGPNGASPAKRAHLLGTDEVHSHHSHLLLHLYV
jgi:hypothetical protein